MRMAAVGIGVSDMEKSISFYTGMLGMKKTAEFTLPKMHEVILGFEGGASLALMHFTDGSARNYKNNPIKLVFRLSVDPMPVFEKIRGAGYEIAREPVAVPQLGGAIIGFALDPDGYEVELIKYPD
jgi:lactoylglutathione lyase